VFHDCGAAADAEGGRRKTSARWHEYHQRLVEKSWIRFESHSEDMTMNWELLFGIFLATCAGIGTGTLALPMKLMRKLQFEQYWFAAMLTGLILIPWSFVWLAIPDPLEKYAQVGWRPLVVANLISVGWGIANVLFGVCVIRIGAALTGAIMSGMAVSAGVTLPMIIKGSGQFSNAPGLLSPAGLAVLGGVAMMVAGVTLCAVAGFGRDRAIRKADEPPPSASGGFLGGLIMSVLAGILSAGISLSYVYGQAPIREALKYSHVGAIPTDVAVWAAVLFGGALVNIAYPAWLMTRNRSWAKLTTYWPDVVLSAVLGAQIIVAIFLIGYSMLVLGALGAAIGFGIQQTTQVVGNQAVGFFSGEWRGIKGKPLRQMLGAVAILILAVIILAYAQTLG
jgi:L-rhamnose-H+ transport protein